jgi:hypothetical protein
VARYEPRLGTGKGCPPAIEDTEHQVDARLRFEQALASVDKLNATLLVHVCIADESPSTWKPDRPKDGAPCLRLALDALADHYRGGVAQVA